ncbi:DNA photolyase family protein [Lentibacter sp. XHP0401]|nr:DNA photolyase family protein [Lentibacter sp. XHP0401]
MSRPVIWWVRRDMRLTDNEALCAALEAGPVIPLFIYETRSESLGAAPRWRLKRALEAFSEALSEKGSKLVLRRGAALDVLRDVIAESGATQVHWGRLYDPASRRIDSDIKKTLRADGVQAHSHIGHILHEPMSVKTQTGDFYKVFTPFWRNIQSADVAFPKNNPKSLPQPEGWPTSECLNDWAIASDMYRGADVLARYSTAGEAAAWQKLYDFLEERAVTYKAARDRLAENGTSDLSDNLAYGEISPRTIWHLGQKAIASGAQGLEPFLRQIAWRDFAHHLMYHTPHMLQENWREGWDNFPWNEDTESSAVMAWKMGTTGIDFVDAAMRELWVTGKMHNRARMVVASYLTKHMMVHWRVGEQWFADQLIDYDPANNAMGWQWVAGSGPDAAPYFRVFNPDTQLEKFDPKRAYFSRWVAEGQVEPPQTALDFFDAIPKQAQLSSQDTRPKPIVRLKEGRERALAAYSAK